MNLSDRFASTYRSILSGYNLPHKDAGYATIWEVIEQSYSEPHRHYHTLKHIEHCLTVFDETKGEVRPLHKDAVEMAIFFHDFTYNPRDIGNEEKSAEAAYNLLGEDMPEPFVRHVYQLVQATSHITQYRQSVIDAGYLVGIDLAIFGSPEPEFWEYEANIRKEYEHVPYPTYCEVRAQILQTFTRSSRIYEPRALWIRYEKQAEKNLTASIAKLKTGIRKEEQK